MSQADADVNDSLLDGGSARALLPDNDPSEVKDKKQIEFEKDVKKLKTRIENTLMI